MNETATIPQRIESIREAVRALLKSMEEQAAAVEGLEPSTALANQCQALEANDYRVLVVGEAKRGKSSFINALIGRDLLPTNVAIATSQVFRVRNAAQEAYRVRFEDGSSREISVADLATYGSQVVADIAGLPNLRQIIRWIEVDVPTHFLPNGISILDTPGLGGLYAGHAQITHRFVPSADAVIFVLDSHQPIIQREVDLIRTLLNITPNIFFIQTKIDTLLPQEWQALQQRNEQILAEHFKDQLTDIRVWPISSTYLLEAIGAEGIDEDYLQASHYSALAAVLQVFLFRTAGWERVARAAVTAESYYVSVRKMLAERLASLSMESEEQRTALQRRIAERKALFEQAWGESGTEKIALLQQIRAIAEGRQQAFLQELRPGCAVEMQEQAKIDSLSSLKEATTYNSIMADRVVGIFLDKWNQTWRQTRRDCLAALTQFLVAADALNTVEDVDQSHLILREAPNLAAYDVSSLVKEKVLAEVGVITDVVRSLSQFLDFFTLLTQESGYYATSDETLPVSNLLNEITKMATVFYIAIRGKILMSSMQLEEVKKQLHQYLDEVLQSIRDQFLDKRLGNGYQNRVEIFFATLESNVSNEIQQIATKKSDEVQAEIARLTEDASLSAQQRAASIQQLQQQLAQWDTLSSTIRGVMQEIERLSEVLSAFGTTNPSTV